MVREARCFVLLAAFIFAFSLVSAKAMATPRPFSIDAEEASRSLLEFGRQSAVQILFASEKVKGITTNSVHGSYEPIDALRLLLKGTPLVISEKPDGVLVVEPQTNAKGVNQMPVPSEEAGGTARVSQTTKANANAQFGTGASQNTGANSSLDGPSNLDKTSLTEIIVTARKREERLIDVPISIVAMSAEELRQREITSIDDLQFAVPGLAIRSNGQSRSIEIRGISNISGNQSLVGTYLDEAAVTGAGGAGAQLDLSTYDMQRVEVLRGPQGTLFGQGSVGGTIRFITKNPDLGGFSMNADVAALFTEDGAPGQRVSSVVNVPVIDDILALRVAATFDHEGGWIDQPAADRKDINGQDKTDVRIKGLWQAAAQFTVSAMAEIHRNDTSPQMGEDSNGNFTQSFNLTTTPSAVDDFNIYNLTLTYDAAPVRLLSTTSYVSQEVAVSDQGYQIPLLGPPPTAPFELYYTAPEVHGGDNLNQELRLTSIDSGPWQWTLGGFYQHFRYNEDVTYAAGLPGPLPAGSVFSDQSTLSKSWAVFGDTSYKLIDGLTVGAGLRYFRDDEQFTSSSTGTAANTQVGAFHAVSPRGYAQYELANDFNVYASAGKGFRSGGFNGENQPPYGPESVWTYELGTKMSSADRRFGADMAVFYSDYTNYQIIGVLPPPAPLVNIYSNAGSASIKGLEWDFTWHPSDGWTLGFNGEALDTRFYKINVTRSAYAVGDGLDFVPKNSFTASARREFIWNAKPGFVRLDYNQQGRETYRNRSIGPWFYNETDVIHMLNLNTSVDWSSNLRLGFFAQNLLNDRNFINPFSIENLAPRSRPRTVGLEFGVTF